MFALVSKNIAVDFMSATNIPVIPLNSYGKLDAPVTSHPDMLFCIIDKNISCYKDYFEENICLFKDLQEYNIIKVSHFCDKKYPYDIGLNVLVVGKRIFCKREYTAKEIIEYGTKSGYKIIDVNQGYASCSTLVINENSAITSDKSIYNALVNEGIDTLLISTNDIHLEGYNCGFVGGSGCILNKTAYFFGEIENMSEFDKISTWLNDRKINYKSILAGGVSDFGGVKLV